MRQTDGAQITSSACTQTHPLRQVRVEARRLFLTDLHRRHLLRQIFFEGSTKPPGSATAEWEMPAVLVELAFISNPEEAALMRDRPDLFARGVYDGILDFTSV